MELKKTPIVGIVEKKFKPKPWLKKPAEEKKVQGYYYVKAKFKKIAHEEIEKLTQQWK